MHPMSELRLAMWSGPRNISTALLRSWGARADTFVCDEPLYAHYLQHTGLPHPGADLVMRRHETDWRKVVAWLTGPIPQGRPIFYQKHMAHHLLPDIERDWLDRLTHCFLIRDPREMLPSLLKKYPEARSVEHTGLPQQVALFEAARRRTGATPAVIDARDVLENPEGLLRRLCAVVGAAFTPRMLSWAPGRRETDGVWAAHWYDAVEKSTGFQPYASKHEPAPADCRALLDACMAYYEPLHAQRLVS